LTFDIRERGITFIEKGGGRGNDISERGEKTILGMKRVLGEIKC
jgi:hypothetical protein